MITEVSVLDSSKIREFMTCPRKYFFRHVLGWRGEGKNIHLVFGSAWHEAMEHLMITKPDVGYAIKEVPAAFDKFLAIYRAEFDESWDVEMAPKNPDVAFQALCDYCVHYKQDEFKVLHTEVTGSVPVFDGSLGKVKLFFKIDTIVEGPEGVSSLEHKTTKYNTATWADQFKLSTQVGTYTHALRAHYGGEDKVYGITINGTIFQKKGIGFARVPVRMMDPQMLQWWVTVQYWIESILTEYEVLRDEVDGKGDVLKAFPMNTEACCQYTTCQFHPFCMAWPNPLQRCKTPPPGMVEEFWNPLEEKGKVVMDVKEVMKDAN